MKSRWSMVPLVGLLAASATAVGVHTASADVSQTPVETGCPAGFSLFAVPVPGTSPYGLPARLDDPANGGNGDGYVCALQLPIAVVAAYCNHLEPRACRLEELGLPLYEFTEDNNPAQGAQAAVIDYGG